MASAHLARRIPEELEGCPARPPPVGVWRESAPRDPQAGRYRPEEKQVMSLSIVLCALSPFAASAPPAVPAPLRSTDLEGGASFALGD